LPTIITHAVIAGAAGKAFGADRMPIRFWFFALICSVLPDADVVTFGFGIEYGDFFGHRGFFHSIFFAFVFSAVIVVFFFRDRENAPRKWWQYFIFFSLVSASHGVLDALTNGGLGIALLSPFDNTRYFFPWTPIAVSPIGLKAFLSQWGMNVLKCEMIYIWVPVFITTFFIYMVKRKNTGDRRGDRAKHSTPFQKEIVERASHKGATDLRGHGKRDSGYHKDT